MPLALTQAIELVSIDSLHPHPRNPRQGDVGAVATSIAENGWFGACLVQRKGTGARQRDTIVAGEHRWRGLAMLQRDGWHDLNGDPCTYEQLAEWVPLPPMGQVPVIARGWTDDQAVRILIADNRTNDLATYNDHELAELLRDLADTTTAELHGTGFDGDDLDELIARLNVESTAPLSGDQSQDQMIAQWAVVIECRDESDQRAILQELSGRGLNVRAMVR